MIQKKHDKECGQWQTVARKSLHLPAGVQPNGNQFSARFDVHDFNPNSLDNKSKTKQTKSKQRQLEDFEGFLLFSNNA